jgi:hypothetical protein
VICGKYLAKRMKEEKRLKRTGFSPSALPIAIWKGKRKHITKAPEGRNLCSPRRATFSNDVTGENKEQE